MFLKVYLIIDMIVIKVIQPSLGALSWSRECLSGKDYHLFISSSSHHDESLCIISSSIMCHHHWAHWASRRCEKFLRSCEGGRCCAQPGILHFWYNAIMLDITTKIPTIWRIQIAGGRCSEPPEKFCFSLVLRIHKVQVSVLSPGANENEILHMAFVSNNDI